MTHINTRRWAKSYSIVDHQILHSGLFHKLSPYALALYLFLVVVGDCEGKSFYSEVMIRNILRLSKNTYETALSELTRTRLIHYRCPYFWINNFPLERTSP